MTNTLLSLRKPIHKTRPRQLDPTAFRRVDFHSNARDLMAVVYAACGLSTKAIAAKTGLSIGQVTYRIGKSEYGRRKGELTQRMSYRSGEGHIVNTVLQTAMKSAQVKKHITGTLDKRGLYGPKPKGVMRNSR